jgi:hypothetical protein
VGEDGGDNRSQGRSRIEVAGDSTARDALRQILAFDELHHQRVVFDAVDMRDVGMIERREDFGFALESRQPFAIVGDISGEDLDGDLALQPRIARPIHLSHTAGAKLRDDLVRTDLLSGSKGHEI